MQWAKNRFDKNIGRVKNLDSLYLHFTTTLKIPHNDVADILRSEIMYLISAFDKFIHDIVRQGMVDSFMNNRPKTKAFKNFTISLNQFQSLNNFSSVPPPHIIFENIVTENHKHLSFQTPEKVSDALSLIWNETHKWQKIANCMSLPEDDVRVELKNIVIRRNQIVHESDVDLMTSNIQPISHNDVNESINFIEKLAACIYSNVNS